MQTIQVILLTYKTGIKLLHGLQPFLQYICKQDQCSVQLIENPFYSENIFSNKECYLVVNKSNKQYIARVAYEFDCVVPHL